MIVPKPFEWYQSLYGDGSDRAILQFILDVCEEFCPEVAMFTQLRTLMEEEGRVYVRYATFDWTSQFEFDLDQLAPVM